MPKKKNFLPTIEITVFALVIVLIATIFYYLGFSAGVVNCKPKIVYKPCKPINVSITKGGCYVLITDKKYGVVAEERYLYCFDLNPPYYKYCNKLGIPEEFCMDCNTAKGLIKGLYLSLLKKYMKEYDKELFDIKIDCWKSNYTYQREICVPVK